MERLAKLISTLWIAIVCQYVIVMMGSILQFRNCKNFKEKIFGIQLKMELGEC